MTHRPTSTSCHMIQISINKYDCYRAMSDVGWQITPLPISQISLTFCISPTR